MHKLLGLETSQRQAIRSDYRKKRQALSSKEQSTAAHNLLKTCLTSTTLAQSKTIACYIANDGEIDPVAIIDYCWQQGKRVLLPVLHPFSKGHLLFVEYHPKSPTRKNVYGIDEPIANSTNIHTLDNIELILTPLVAFDAKGNRLGMGGGYYDRTLAPIRRDSLPTQLIGLAHTCQQTDQLLTDSWDIPLNAIATPDQFFDVS
ncbi:5-formyltetrahydrofolate cyclo-ligase [Paraglaciecola sp. MB-3u-78]|uniref:5-formyltetrahydrofolate cyclo-ligase n=1 Tax=Paraglaciecola sp. MB-3u-78 TaxID=2058332 RepID=UPI000C31C958|nr:5-formyltetrahydrofolate cyclo-ligase [Paraglaciecola sp. MB-3u-78]PKG93361.1 5-formyltetrahydrofolate cyclo-ligase [Paraglaciecola sp. MB-3u-78]